jgi:hypothetical protein
LLLLHLLIPFFAGCAGGLASYSAAAVALYLLLLYLRLLL